MSAGGTVVGTIEVGGLPGFRPPRSPTPEAAARDSASVHYGRETEAFALRQTQESINRPHPEQVNAR